MYHIILMGACHVHWPSEAAQPATCTSATGTLQQVSPAWLLPVRRPALSTVEETEGRQHAFDFRALVMLVLLELSLNEMSTTSHLRPAIPNPSHTGC